MKTYSFFLALGSYFLRISSSKRFASANCSIAGRHKLTAYKYTLSLSDDSSDLFFLMGYFSLCPRYSLTFDLAEDQAETVRDASCF